MDINKAFEWLQTLPVELQGVAGGAVAMAFLWWKVQPRPLPAGSDDGSKMLGEIVQSMKALHKRLDGFDESLKKIIETDHKCATDVEVIRVLLERG